MWVKYSKKNKIRYIYCNKLDMQINTSVLDRLVAWLQIQMSIYGDRYRFYDAELAR